MKGNLGSRWRLGREDKETQRYCPLSLPQAAEAELRFCVVRSVVFKCLRQGVSKQHFHGNLVAVMFLGVAHTSAQVRMMHGAC